MQKKQVAILDVGSSKISAVISERGVNKTFNIKARKDFNYDGFVDGVFLDEENLKRILASASEFIIKMSSDNVDTVYVGVPGAFSEVVVKDSQITFSKRTKISDKDVERLFESAFIVRSEKRTLINHSAIVYELDDLRMLANPVDCYSEVLKGKLSFVMCDNYFIETIKSALLNVGIPKIDFVSTPLAEAMYLIDNETRDRIVILIDIGYISTSFSLIQGDGILYQSSFSYGGGYITGAITEKFDIDFADAEILKRKVSLSKVSDNSFDLVSSGNGEYYGAENVRSIIKRSLDKLCDEIDNCKKNSGFIIPDSVPIYITGGGISYIRGAKERLADRFGTMVEILSPKIPLMEKPTESSVLSLLDLTF
ncbi:MAG: pilus assembly protein PilM [Clostridia bacterium]|nr:pilus assembly protein PilM [Clostridia bacterium]